MSFRRSALRVLSIVVTISFFAGCSAEKSSPAQRAAPRLRFNETTQYDGNTAGEACSRLGQRVQSFANHVVRVQDASGRNLEPGKIAVRIRNVALWTPAILLDKALDAYLVGEPGQGHNGEIYFLAPVGSGGIGAPAHMDFDTRVVAVEPMTTAPEIRERIRTVIAGSKSRSGFFSLGFTDDEVAMKQLSELGTSTAVNSSAMELSPEYLDPLLPEPENPERQKGIVLELEPPATEYQTDSTKLLLWYQEKGNPKAVGSELTCR